MHPVSELVDADAVVIGGGHNGLICAAYLAKSGLRTVLYEARDSVGGCASSEDVFGARVNICNCDHISFRSTPVMDELDLGSHGLRYLDVEPGTMNLSWDEQIAWPTFHDVERTAEGLQLVLPGEVDGYRRYVKAAVPVARLIVGAAADLPTRPRLVKGVLDRRGKGVVTMLRWSRMSAAAVLREFFTSDAILAPLLAAGPVVWGISPETPGTGLGALGLAMRHALQVGRPVGGSGMLPTTLRRAFEAHGGTVVTSTTVEAITSGGGAVRGVRLADGSEVRARIVVSACDPRSTFVDWLERPPAVAQPVVRRWAATEPEDGYESKLDAVVTALPRYLALANGIEDRLGFDALRASMMISPSTAELHRGAALAREGKVMDRPVFFANLPTVIDPSMAPDGKHVFSLETLFTPYALPGGWPGSSEPQRWLDRYATLLEPGFLDGIEQWRAMTPDRYEQDFHLPRGHATSFAGGPLAALRGNPRELTRYTTPVQGLFLTGAATFPGAGVWGASGRNAALTVLATL
jgi:phytoene dehydrogenase-like protein